MSKLFQLVIICTLALCIPLVCSAQKHKDRVISTHHIQGKLVGFEMGDYLHADFRTTAGKKRSFFMGPNHLHYFLAVNNTNTFDLTYVLVDSWIEEAGGYQRITRLTDAHAGALTFRGWYASERKKYKKEE